MKKKMKKKIVYAVSGTMLLSSFSAYAKVSNQGFTENEWSCSGSAEAGTVVTSVLYKGDEASGDYDKVIGIKDTYAGEDNTFSIDIKIPEGVVREGEKVTSTVWSDGKSETNTFYYEPYSTEGLTVSERYSLMNKKLKRLKELIAECEKSGIGTDYEKVDCTVIEDFITYGLEDLNGGNAERSEYVLGEIENMYVESRNKLYSYLDGSEKPINVIRNDIGIEALSFDGMSVKNETKPVFLTGFLGYDGLVKDFGKMQNMGFNSASIEIGVKDVIVNPADSFYGGWQSTYYNGINPSTCKMTLENGIGTASGRGLRLNNTAEYAANRYVILSQTVPVEQNTEYEFGLDSRTVSGAGVKMFVGGWSGAAFYAQNTSSVISVSKGTYKTGNTDRITVWILSDNTGENIIDNVFVKKKGTNDNVVLNGDFETDLEVVDGIGIDRGAIRLLKNDLDKALENGIAVNLLISPHYFPGYILSEDSSYSRSGGSSFGAGGVEWYKDRIKQVLSLYADALTDEIKDYPALFGICLTNEPMFNLMYSPESFAKPYWTAWLKAKYGNISTLNSKWGTYYLSFDTVKIPSGIKSTHYAYEWELMNRELFAEWHGDIAKVIKSIAPRLVVHAKEINYLSSKDVDYERNFLTVGTDARLFSEFSDVHGCDAHGYLEETHVYQLQNKFQWYDYLTTIEEKTIFNSEDHVIMDGSQIYSENQAKHVYTDMFQGAIHGRGISNIWVYGRTQGSGNAWSDSIMHRPDVIKSTGRASLDINRLADEITALQNKDAEIAIVFSDASRRYDRNHMNALYQSYKAAIYSGFRVAVVDEQSILEGKADKCQAIILPNVKYLSEDAINKLASSGAKKIIIGDNCAKYNCYKRTHESSITTSLTNGATVINASFSNYAMTSPSVSQIQNTIQSNTKNNVSIKSSGTVVTDTEYRAVPYKNGWLVNMCSYDFDNAKNVEIYIDGEKISEFKDLKDNMVRSELILNGYEPELIYVDMSKVRLSEKNGVVTAKNNTSENITGAYMVNAGYDSTGKMETCQLIPFDIDANGETEKAVQLDSTVHRIFVLESLNTLTSCSEVLEIN